MVSRVPPATGPYNGWTLSTEISCSDTVKSTEKRLYTLIFISPKTSCNKPAYSILSHTVIRPLKVYSNRFKNNFGNFSLISFCGYAMTFIGQTCSLSFVYFPFLADSGRSLFNSFTIFSFCAIRPV